MQREGKGGKGRSVGEAKRPLEERQDDKLWHFKLELGQSTFWDSFEREDVQRYSFSSKLNSKQS